MSDSESKICNTTLQSVRTAGSCNFCSRHNHDTVWVVASMDEHRHLHVRICPQCMKELRHSLRITDANSVLS